MKQADHTVFEWSSLDRSSRIWMDLTKEARIFGHGEQHQTVEHTAVQDSGGQKGILASLLLALSVTVN